MLPHRIIQANQFVSHLLLRRIFQYLFDMKVINANHLTMEPNTIFISNHFSFLDPFVIGCSFPKKYDSYPVFPMTNNRSMRNPAFWLPLRLLGGFHANKGKGFRKATQFSIQLLRDGGRIVIFPEGKRKRNNGRLLNPRRGFIYIAHQTNATIVPLYLDGLFCMTAFEFLKRTRKLRVIVGEPFTYEDICKREPRTVREWNSAANRAMRRVRILPKIYKHKLR